MATQNRGTRITKLLGQIKKHYKSVPPPQGRTLVEHLLFACLLENSPHEAAEQAFADIQKQYFDWNEVRVSTKRELAEAMRGLNDPGEAAERLKRTLHSLFETAFSYDLEALKKQNLGQAAKTIEKYQGATPFTVAYVTQHALGGHAIPANQGLLIAFVAFDIITQAEADKWTIPGLERAAPKSKGIEVATILHQLGVEVGKNPYGQAARKALLAIDPSCKSRLPKKPEPPPVPQPETKKTKQPKPAAANHKAAPAAGKKPATGGAKKTSGDKSAQPVKKKTKKKVAKSAGKPATGGAKKKAKTAGGKKITKRKPR